MKQKSSNIQRWSKISNERGGARARANIMRKVMLLILICLSFIILLPGCLELPVTGWINISCNTEAENYSLILADGAPYLALGIKANVKKYVDPGWLEFGNWNFSVGEVDEIELTSENGLFYVAFNDTVVGRGIVMKCKDGIWERIGKTGYFSTGEVCDISVIVKDQVPYLSYRDKTDSKFRTVKVEGDVATVLNEVPLLPEESIYMMDLAVKDGDIYLFCSINAAVGKLKAMKLNGINWDGVGEYSPTGNIYAFSQDWYDQQFFISYNTGERIKVIKFDGLNWSSLPDPGIVRKTITLPDGTAYTGPKTVCLSAGSGQIHLLYGDGDMNFRASVKQFNGSNWEDVGRRGFSDGSILDGRIICDDDRVYVGFLEEMGDFDTGYAKVWRRISYQ